MEIFFILFKKTIKKIFVLVFELLAYFDFFFQIHHFVLISTNFIYIIKASKLIERCKKILKLQYANFLSSSSKKFFMLSSKEFFWSVSKNILGQFQPQSGCFQLQLGYFWTQLDRFRPQLRHLEQALKQLKAQKQARIHKRSRLPACLGPPKKRGYGLTDRPTDGHTLLLSRGSRLKSNQQSNGQQMTDNGQNEQPAKKYNVYIWTTLKSLIFL